MIFFFFFFIICAFLVCFMCFLVCFMCILVASLYAFSEIRLFIKKKEEEITKHYNYFEVF